jgi:hypothetical protein
LAPATVPKQVSLYPTLECADDQPEPAGLTPEDIAAALGMPPADLETGSDDEEVQEQVPVPTKKSTSTTSKSSKKKADQLETEYKKASEHPDIAKVEKSRKRGTTEGPDESAKSPKKVNPSYLPAIVTKLTVIG